VIGDELRRVLSLASLVYDEIVLLFVLSVGTLLFLARRRYSKFQVIGYRGQYLERSIFMFSIFSLFFSKRTVLNFELSWGGKLFAVYC